VFGGVLDRRAFLDFPSASGVFAVLDGFCDVRDTPENFTHPLAGSAR
jgi:hypothetical protein